jgi:hypothetical protein
MDIKLLRLTADNLFTKRTSLISRWQEIAENFYPERADFTVRRTLGDQFADGLMTSYPIQCRRDLGDQIGMMLRPTAKEWFKPAVTDTGRETGEAKIWLERAGGVMRRAMYDRITHFSRSTKEADHDFAAFGQHVQSVRLNKNGDALLYRCWHLRDVAWMENEEGNIDFIARKWKPTSKDLMGLFGSKNHQDVGNEARKQPFGENDCYHIICGIDMYDGGDMKTRAAGLPYWSIYYDIKHNHVIEAIPVWNKEYIISRWQTVSGSQYAFSPATIVALPDARLIQSMTYTLLEAGEKATNPPMIATKDAVKSDVAIYAGGITWVDADYDERLGESLRPINQDYRQLPIGLDMQQDARLMLSQAFFLNKLNLPERTPDATAYEIGQRVQEYIRGALPIFEPMEQDCNGQLCEATFDLLLRGGAFGSPYDMPEELRGADIHFRFESPLHDAIEQQKGNKFMEMKGLIAESAALDPSAVSLPNFKVALRDALNGMQVPAAWLNSEKEVKDSIDQQQQMAQMAQMLQAGESAGKAAQGLTAAEKNLSEVAA